MAKTNKPTQRPVSKPPLEIHWRPGSFDDYRMWNNSWYGDQFEVLSKEDFDKAVAFFQRFSIPVVDKTHDDD